MVDHFILDKTAKYNLKLLGSRDAAQVLDVLDEEPAEDNMSLIQEDLDDAL